MRRRWAVSLVVGAALALAGCINVQVDSSGDAASGDFNDADVAFAQQMIPHHQQALIMAEAAEEGAKTADLQELAGRIKDAQAPEIEQMTGWLESWGKDVPDLDSMSHMMMGHGDDDLLNDMPGMMDGDQMSQMMQMMGGGTAFDRMWLLMMIQHHEGAIEMSKDEIANGQNPEAIALARHIATSQAAEIVVMKKMIRDLPIITQN